MNHHPRAGKLAKQCDLINIARLTSQYYVLQPEIGNIKHAVKFGTSGHRGSASRQTFNEMHILAITQAIVEERKKNGITGPCYVGKDTHALSEPAIISVLEVLTANFIHVIIQKDNGYTPTPSISHAIIEHNKLYAAQSDGILLTPSHNPPEYGGIKYNSPNGGPANTNITKAIQDCANSFINVRLKGVRRITINQALISGYLKEKDLIDPYIKQLPEVINIKAIQQSGLKMAVDPLGGSGIVYWQRIAEFYNLNLTIVNDTIDQTFRFMHLDYDGLIRMDCSSEFAMRGLLSLRDKLDIAFANDPDYDRHGIVTPSGLMYPNHYLASAIQYLFQNRLKWKSNVAVGKTLVSSTIIDCVVKHLGRKIVEVPVGFKWFVNGLFYGRLGFCGEESAGASFLRFDGRPWSTDKDGIIMCLLAAEMTAVTGKNPQQYYDQISSCFGITSYNRLQSPLTLKDKNVLSQLTKSMIKNINKLAGDPIIKYLTTAPGNGAAISGLKVITKNGWFVVRPSGTEEVYKIYCESFISCEHRLQIEKEALKIINKVLKEN